ncbi:MAG: ArsR family transcriptional regulator [Candidatus Thorarchaeota archaeon]|jgi:DNA-binding transcriptional ArsR family regulator
MDEDIDEIKRELEEIRRIKEEMKRELQEAKQERLEALKQEKLKLSKPPKPPKPLKAPRAPRAPRRASIVDLRGLTDSLESMMEGLEDSIRDSVSGWEEIGKVFSGPALRAGKRKKVKRKRDRDFEMIPPERVAKIVSPLGSEERLRILDFLKEGGRTVNDLETHTGKTGSSLTHHLTPLLEAGYVIKGEVRGTYYVTVEGRLAYRLAQWLTSKVERQQERTVNGTGEEPLRVVVDKEDDGFTVRLNEAASDEADEVEDELHDHVQDEIDKYHDKMDEHQDQLDEIQDKMDEIQDQMDEEIEELEEEEDR